MDPLLEERTVSRKTPRDGKLEITRPTGLRLEQLGNPTLEIETPAGPGTATLTTQACTCRGPDNPHEHWFLTSPLFRALVPGSIVSLSLESARIVVRPTGRLTD